MTTYRVIDQHGTDHHFLRYIDAKNFAYEVSRLTGKGVEIAREPKEFAVKQIMVSVPFEARRAQIDIE